MKKVLGFITAGGIMALPALAFAQAPANNGYVNTNGLNTSIRALTNTVNNLVPFLLAIAVVVFIYGIVRYVIAGNAEAKEGARTYIIWGIIGIAVILAVFGLANLLVNIFGLNQNNTIANLPTVNANLVTNTP